MNRLTQMAKPRGKPQPRQIVDSDDDNDDGRGDFEAGPSGVPRSIARSLSEAFRHSAGRSMGGEAEIEARARAAAAANSSGGVAWPTLGDWRRNPVRTQKSQKKYTEERLYRKPAGRPGSIAALQMRLDALREERKASDGVAAAASGVTPGRSRSAPRL